MMEMKKQHFQRWYDKKPEMSRSIQILASFPTEIQSIVSKGIVEMADKEFAANELVRSYKSLGAEKVLGLYKSKKKMRTLDKNPDVHQAMTYLYVLSEDNQLTMAHKILDLMEYIHKYFSTCKTYSQQADEKTLMLLTKTYIHQGKENAQSFLKELEVIFLDRVHQTGTRIVPKPTGVPLGKSTEEVMENEAGLKVRD